MRWTLIGCVVAGVALSAGLAFRLGGGPPAARAYPQATPDAAIEAAFEMIESGDAGRLPDLLHAESDAMRAAFDELALLCNELQEVAEAAHEAFPEEAARLRDAFRDDPGGTLAALRPGRGSIDPSGGPGREMMRAILADPYGWLLAFRGRLSTATIDDSRAAVQFDNAPVFGVGLLMRRGDDGRWRVELPLRFPGSSAFTPQNDDEWSIVGSMLRVIASAVDELEADIRAGRARDTSHAAILAGEKALAPIVLCGIAYRQAIEAREGG